MKMPDNSDVQPNDTERKAAFLLHHLEESANEHHMGCYNLDKRGPVFHDAVELLRSKGFPISVGTKFVNSNGTTEQWISIKSNRLSKGCFRKLIPEISEEIPSPEELAKMAEDMDLKEMERAVDGTP